uniref:Ig-like domain-containing protein n=1 Tax=Neolamprologus brichardi TaxID=32507 RepID=A0A3Q4HY83_NEOBR
MNCYAVLRVLVSAVEVNICTLTSLLCIVSLSGQKNFTAESGQNVTLTCQARKNIQTVKWSRADLGDEYVFLYRDGRETLVHQHPSFKDRVDLKDKQMKDGDVSLILKNVTINDTGTYECRVVETGTSGLKPISIIYLSVVGEGEAASWLLMFVSKDKLIMKCHHKMLFCLISGYGDDVKSL